MSNSQALKNQTYAQLGAFLAAAPGQAVQLLQLNGVNISQAASPSQIQIAFLAAVQKSSSFRSQAAVAISQWLTGRPQAATSNFVDNVDKVYLNDIDSSDTIGIDPNSFSMPVAGSGMTDSLSDTSSQDTPIAQSFNIDTLTPQQAAPTVDTTVTPGTASGMLNPGAVAGDVVSAASVKAASGGSSSSASPNLITSGLNLIGQEIASQTAKTNAQSALGLAQANLAAQALKNQQPTTNWTSIIVWVVAIGAIGGIAYAIFHKKKAPVAAAA